MCIRLVAIRSIIIIDLTRKEHYRTGLLATGQIKVIIGNMDMINFKCPE